MIAIVLIGIMVDRAALTLRNLAIAALFVMVLAPESVVHPSFQMSFAATYRLVLNQIFTPYQMEIGDAVDATAASCRTRRSPRPTTSTS